MNGEEHKIIQEILKEVFANVNNWLTHAETKNAALIAFNVACLSFLWDINSTNKNITLFYIVCIGMVLSTVMSLISFIPQMGKKVNSKGKHSAYDNLIFYVDISKYNKGEYIKAVYKQYAKMDISDSDVLKIEDDLSAEITYNSTVVIRKYKWFNYAIKSELICLILLVIAMICNIIN